MHQAVPPDTPIREAIMRVLFLCTGNSCLSQMAEGWVRTLRPELDVQSAGIEKHGMNPLAVRAMAEAGVDISGQRSKTLDELENMDFDLVVTVCDHAREHCPLFPGQGQTPARWLRRPAPAGSHGRDRRGGHGRLPARARCHQAVCGGVSVGL